MNLLIVLSLAAASVAACGGGNKAAVECKLHEDCNLEFGGSCDIYAMTGNRWCVYPDTACPSGRRWSDFDTGDGLSGICQSDDVDGGAGTIDAMAQIDAATVDAPFGTPDATVDAPFGTPDAGVDAPFGTADAGVDAPFGTPDAGVDAPFGTPDAGIDAPFGMSDAGIADAMVPTCEPKILFTRTSGSGTYTVNPNGTGETLVAAGWTYEFGWSYDGMKVLHKNYNTSVIRVLDANGTNEVSIDVGSTTLRSPKWSSTAMRIAYVVEVGGVYEIHIVDPDGNNDVRIHFTSFAIGALVWSHSGTTLAFSTLSPNADLYTINADGTGLKNVTSNGTMSYDSFSWTPTDTRLVFVRTASDGSAADIYSIVADGTGITQLTTNGSSLKESGVVVAPDGASFAYSGVALTAGGSVDGVYSRNIDGTGGMLLSSGENVGLGSFQPSYSPDGSKIAYNSHLLSTGANEDIWVVNANGTGQLRLTIAGTNYGPQWRPCP